MTKCTFVKVPSTLKIVLNDSSVTLLCGKVSKSLLIKKPIIVCEFIVNEKWLRCSTSPLANKNKTNNKKKAHNKNLNKFITNLKMIIKGFTSRFFIDLTLVGVGYRFVSFNKKDLLIKLGFCSPVCLPIPLDVEVLMKDDRSLSLVSSDYNLLHQTASLLKSCRRPDSYKGKGVVFLKDSIQLKEVKKSQ